MINLIVVAHPDDEILGFGATGTKLVAKGEEVQALILCGNVEVRNKRPEINQLKQNIISANNSLGFKEPIIDISINIVNIGKINFDNNEILIKDSGDITEK